MKTVTRPQAQNAAGLSKRKKRERIIIIIIIQHLGL